VSRSWFWRAAVVFALTLTSFVVGCSRKRDDGTRPEPVENLPEIVLRDDSPNLLLTWLDERGGAHTELKPSDVPAQGRSLVRVVLADREEGTRERFYVTDLSKKRDDGTYPVRTMSRREWESEMQRRRDGELAKRAPPPAPPDSAPPAQPGTPPPAPSSDPSGVTVIIYGASWCGPCHDAAKYLKSRGVPYVLKDIEVTPGAAAEMRQKLERSGNRGGSIPVIDVRGQILIGYSQGALDRALRKAAGGTVL
jgi:glutaredoxin